MAERMGYRPELDGVRALAIGAVIASHSIPNLDGGYVGVDVFFVLSGFLITSLLLEERRENEEINVPRFYGRRAVRLLPALLLAIVLVVVLVAIGGGEKTDLVWTLPAVLFYVTNWTLGFTHVHVGYFSHAWSLAIEEQYYLVWPWVIVAFGRRRDFAAWLAAAVVSIVLVRAGLAATLHPRGLDDITPLRADGLLLGALVAVLYRRRREMLAPLRSAAAGWLALVGIVVTMGALCKPGFRNAAMGSSTGYAAVSVFSAVLIAHLVLGGESRLGRVFRWRPAVLLGMVSYGVYILHFPVFLFIATRWPGLPWPIAVVIKYTVTAALVVASWKLVERPVSRRLRQRFAVGQVDVRGESVNA